LLQPVLLQAWKSSNRGWSNFGQSCGHFDLAPRYDLQRLLWLQLLSPRPVLLQCDKGADGWSKFGQTRLVCCSELHIGL
jgi:hypothetical protein